MRFVVVAVLLASTAVRLGAVDEVEVDAAMPWNDADGYTPLVVRVRAHRAVTVAMTAEKSPASALATLTLADGEAERRTLLIPPSSANTYATLRWQVDGGAETTASARGAMLASDRHDIALIDPRETVVIADLAAALDGRVAVRHAGFGATTSTYGADRLARVPGEQIPDRWQGFPGWLTLIVAPAGDAELDDAQRAAIADWTRVGGALFVTAPAQVAAWRARGARATLLTMTATGGGGAATTAPVEDDGFAALIERLAGVMADRAATGSRHRVPGTEHVPVGGFILVAALFALVVGPVNLWWVRWRDARQLFLLTTPLLSLGTCLGLVTFNLVAEGVALRRIVTQYAVLDQSAQRVAAWTATTYFAAFSPSAIELDADSKLTVVRDEDRMPAYAYGGRVESEIEAFALDWRTGQRATGAWIPSRVNRHLVCCQLEPERRRLVVARDGRGWRMTNGLGVAIDALSWRDPAGAWWSCGALADGAGAVLVAGRASDAWPDHGVAVAPRPAATHRSHAVAVAATAETADGTRDDAGPMAAHAIAAAERLPCVAAMTLGGAFLPVPGPRGVDQRAVVTHLLAIVAPDETSAR